MAFELGTFFHFVLLAIFAELGDKTWWLTLAFVAWCPFNGLRSKIAKFYRLECIFVLLGSILALTIRSFLLSIHVNPFSWDGFSSMAAFCLVLPCAIVATIQWRFSLNQNEVLERVPLALSQGSEEATSGEALESGAATESTLYGTVKHPPLEDRWGWARIAFFTLLIPFAAVLFAEAMDRSQGILLTVEHARLDLVMGTPIGFAVAEIFAALFGYLTRWVLYHGDEFVGQTRLLFVLATIFWLVALCCLRDGATRLLLGDMPMPEQ